MKQRNKKRKGRKKRKVGGKIKRREKRRTKSREKLIPVRSSGPNENVGNSSEFIAAFFSSFSLPTIFASTHAWTEFLLVGKRFRFVSMVVGVCNRGLRFREKRLSRATDRYAFPAIFFSAFTLVLSSSEFLGSLFSRRLVVLRCHTSRLVHPHISSRISRQGDKFYHHKHPANPMTIQKSR